MDDPTVTLATDMPDLRDTPLGEITEGDMRNADQHAASGENKLSAAFFQSAV
jgi:hypothetical protein